MLRFRKYKTNTDLYKVKKAEVNKDTNCTNAHQLFKIIQRKISENLCNSCQKQRSSCVEFINK